MDKITYEKYNVTTDGGYRIHQNIDTFEEAVDIALRFDKSKYPSNSVGGLAKVLLLERVVTTIRTVECGWARKL